MILSYGQSGCASFSPGNRVVSQVPVGVPPQVAEVTNLVSWAGRIKLEDLQVGD